jgi:hypothetical protein
MLLTINPRRERFFPIRLVFFHSLKNHKFLRPPFDLTAKTILEFPA